jgi:urease accessory protein
MFITRVALTAAVGTVISTPVFAHAGHGAESSFFAGLAHPVSGLDHLVAMVMVGLLAATMGRKAMLGLPLGFLAAMTAGFGLAVLAVPLLAVEPMILASLIVLGSLVAMSAKMGLVTASATVAFFGLFHGHAHGAELAGANAGVFLTGFVLATAAVQAVGLVLGTAIRQSPLALRIIGGGAAVAGLALAIA